MFEGLSKNTSINEGLAKSKRRKKLSESYISLFRFMTIQTATLTRILGHRFFRSEISFLPVRCLIEKTQVTFRGPEQYYVHRLQHNFLLVNRIFNSEDVRYVLSITAG